jgi:Raf kinase inhibitor-like YbhB/YbcL family protein
MPKTSVVARLLLTEVSGLLFGCDDASGHPGTASLELRSRSFVGDTIAPKYSSCDGQDGTSPELSWSAPPEHAQSFALIVFDKDSPFGFKFTHWVLYDIPRDKRELAEDVAKQEQLPDDSRQAPNDYNKSSYVGSCPPRGTHHYVFILYALDTKPNLPPGASKKQLLKSYEWAHSSERRTLGPFPTLIEGVADEAILESWTALLVLVIITAKTNLHARPRNDYGSS